MEMRARFKPRPQNASKDVQPQHRWPDSTVNRHFAFLRHVLMLAFKDGRLTYNPVSGVKFLQEQKRTRSLADMELTHLRQFLAPEHWTLVGLAIETGYDERNNSACSGIVWTWKMASSPSHAPMLKGGRTSHVAVSDSAQAMLRSLDSFLGSPWVFAKVKHPLQPQNPQSFVNNVYSPALRQAGITGANWHSLRHTAASRRIMAGVDLVSVKEILGHRDIQTTMRYSPLSPAHLRQAVNRGGLGDHLRTMTPTMPRFTSVTPGWRPLTGRLSGWN